MKTFKHKAEYVPVYTFSQNLNFFFFSFQHSTFQKNQFWLSNQAAWQHNYSLIEAALLDVD